MHILLIKYIKTMQTPIDCNYDKRKEEFNYKTPVHINFYKDSDDKAQINIRLENPFKKPIGEDDDMNISLDLREFMFKFAEIMNDSIVND